MKNFTIKKWYLLFVCMFTSLATLTGCSGGVFGGGLWNTPHPPVITAYSLVGAVGTINESAKTISVTVPFATVLTNLTATYATTAISVSVADVPQTSGVAPTNNFTNPVLYTATAADHSTAKYLVTVTVALPIDKAITAYSIDGVVGTINPAAKTILVAMPYGTDVTGSGKDLMRPSFSASATDVRVGGVLQQSPALVSRNFSNLVVYTVTAADTSAVNYTVIVTVASQIDKALTAFSIDGINGVINPTTRTVVVAMPYGTDITGLSKDPMRVTYSASATDVRVVGTLQQSPALVARNFSSLVVYTVTAADTSAVSYTIFVTVAPAIDKGITAYSIDGVVGTINPLTQTIVVTMPYGTDITGLSKDPMRASFTATATDVRVAGTLQQSPAPAARNFSGLVVYTVTAADSSTALYTVFVTVASPIDKAITAFSIDGINGTINPTTRTVVVAMPYGTDITGLGKDPMRASYSASASDVRVAGTLQQSPALTARNFSNLVVYTVTAADTSSASYTVFVTVASQVDKALTAFSIDGVNGTINSTTRTVVVAMPFGTDITGLGKDPMRVTYSASVTDVRVAGTPQLSPAVAARNFSSLVVYTLTAADTSAVSYSVFVTVAPAIDNGITAYSIDGVVGTINPVAKTVLVTMPFGTDITGLSKDPMRASFTATTTDVRVAGTLQQSPAVTARNFSSPVLYTVTSADSSTALYTVIVTVASPIDKAITAFSIDGVNGTINATTRTIVVAMPYGTDITGLGKDPMRATYSASATDVRVAGTLQQSPALAARNFSSLVVYTVTAADSSAVSYAIFVTVAPAIDNSITAYSIDGIVGTINPVAKTILVTMPYGTDITGLSKDPMRASFTATATDVRVAGTLQQSPAPAARNFSGLVVYTVTSADSSTATYTVIVTVASPIDKAITAFSIDGVIGTINQVTKTILVAMPYGTDVTGLGTDPMRATYTATATDVQVGGVVQQSPALAARNFSSMVVYTVTAADGSTVSYTVFVTVASPVDKTITAYSLDGVIGTISQTTRTILVNMPFGTNVTGIGTNPMIATYIASSTDVTVNGASQISGTTRNNFTNPVPYKVTAADTSTATYTVIVTVALYVPTPGDAGAAPFLASADTFGIIANDAITNSGATLMHLYGDVALAGPTSTSTALVAFTVGGTAAVPTSPRVTGQIITTDKGNSALLRQLRLDLQSAYDKNKIGSVRVAPSSVPTLTSNGGTFIPGVVDLSGMVLRPGIYAVGTTIDTFGLSNVAGPLVLDAQGNADAVFIFQADTMTTTTGSVVLQGGANPKNVFWIMTNNATIGTNTFFQGTIVAGRTITINANTIVEGRMLAGADSSAPVGTGNLTVSGIITVPK